jgi:acetyltransferase-like isoleucine patch superfamily enzyme
MNMKLLMKGLRDPFRGYEVLKLIARGQLYKLRYKLLNKNVSIGKNFRVKARLSIKGPGSVVIGDNVFIDGTSHTVTPWTGNADAEIIIGNNVFVNGTRFGCAKKIEVGDNCILADCRILDTDFHSVNPEQRSNPEYIESSPIKIGNNVWIALGCVILKGVTIGDDSTIAAQSVVYGNVEKSSVYGGNPAVLIKRL